MLSIVYTFTMPKKETKKDIPQEPQPEEEKSSQQEVKKLYRSRTDTVIAGVAGGLGEYFSIDPVLIRLIFVMAAIFGGVGIPAYIVLWIILPEEPTDTIGSEETVKKNVNQMKERAESIAQGLRSDSSDTRTRTLIGALLVGLGVMFILDNFGFFRADLFWPLVLVVIGIFILRRS